jgi:hypothetical protein
MATPYTGADQYPIFLTLPDEGEPAQARTVSDQAKALADRTAYLLRRMGGLSGAMSPVKVRSDDGTKVTVYPIAGITVFDAAARLVSTTANTVVTPGASSATPGTTFTSGPVTTSRSSRSRRRRRTNTGCTRAAGPRTPT